MSSLIKINNGTQTNGVIYSDFNVPPVIEPGSSIALLNMSCEMQEVKIEINNNTNTFQVRYAVGGPLRNVVLNVGVYSIDDFIIEINRAMNASILFETFTEVGFEWNITKDNNNILQFIFDRIITASKTPTRKGLSTEIISFRQNINRTSSTEYNKDAGGDAWNAGLCTDYYFSKGCGSIGCTRPANNNHPVIVGLVNDKVLANYNDFDIDNYLYAIYSRQITGAQPGDPHYYILRFPADNPDGYDEIETNVQAGNHYISIITSGGRLYFIYTNPTTNSYLGTQNVNILFDLPWLYNQYLFGMFSIYNQGDIIRETTYIKTPYHIGGVDFEHYSSTAPPYNLRNSYDVDDDNLGSQPASQIQIIFPNDDTLLKYGFRAQPNISPRVKAGEFNAVKSFTDISITQTLKLMIDNLSIDSFDDVKKGPESILHCIPYFDNVNSRFTINMPFLLPRKLNNLNPLRLNRLVLRLVDYDNDLIAIKPYLTDITLLIIPPSDNNKMSILNK